MSKCSTCRHRPKRKSLEFSQGIVIVSWAVTILWITASYVLAFYGHETNSDLSSELVRESFGVTLCYYLYQWGLKSSRNRHGIDAGGAPYKLKQKLKDAGCIPQKDEENE